MENLKKIIIENKIFLIPYLIIVLIASFFLYKYGKVDTHIFINQHYNNFFDTFFKLITHLGDGIFAIIISFILLFIRFRWAIISIISSISIMIVIQILKRVFFAGWFRPTAFFHYFYKEYTLHLTQGINPGGVYSFPSGHSTTVFATFFLLAIIIKNKLLKFIFFIIALLVAFSRVYLSWHFIEDTLAGSFLGIIITLITYLIINKSKKEYLDKSLIKKYHNS